MPALFAIVNDDHPPLPEGVSPAARDFLMQCFQKDPNLRVSAKKLLKHAWIMGSRRSDAPAAVRAPPANFNEAVEEVKQWNEALRSPNGAGSFGAGNRLSGVGLGVSTGNRDRERNSAASPLPLRRDGHYPLRNVQNEQHALVTPAKGPLILQKPANPADAFRSPETLSDDNWDDDFASSISPSALQLPHLKPHDNFGGMFSSDRLKSFALTGLERNEERGEEGDNWDENFEGELEMEGDMVTIKGPRRWLGVGEGDSEDMKTVRPFVAKPAAAPVVPSPPKPPVPKMQAPLPNNLRAPPPSERNQRKRSTTLPQRPKAPKPKDVPEQPQRPGTSYQSPQPSRGQPKFALPTQIPANGRPVQLFREMTNEGFEDLEWDEGNLERGVFERRIGVGGLLLKVCSFFLCLLVGCEDGALGLGLSYILFLEVACEQ
jgi:serine/threonine protein kinase